MKWWRGLAVLGALLGFLSGGPYQKARAMPPSAAPNMQVLRGEAALAVGDLVTAEKIFTTAYRQAPSAELLFQLGRIAAAQEQLLLAQDLMRRYVNNPVAAPDAAKAAAAQQILARPRPPSGKIRVQGDRGGLVLLDGQLRGMLPLVQPLLAAPGPRTVAIQYPGKLLDVQVEVITGRMIDIQCTRATGAIFLATPPALLLLPELSEMTAAMPEAMPEALSDQLLDAVERAAQGRQLTILKPEALLMLIPELKNLPAPQAQAELRKCLLQAECVQRLLQKTKLDYALRVRASATAAPPENKTPGTPGTPGMPGMPGTPSMQDTPDTQIPKQWEFATELLHVSVLGVASAQTQRCVACRDVRAAASLQEAVSRTLSAGLTRHRGTLTVSSDPQGAEVWLGDRMLGQTPLALPTWPGEYMLELRQPDRTPMRRTAAVESGKTAEVVASLALVMTPPPTLAPPPTIPSTIPPTIIAPPVVPPAVPQHWQRAPRPRWRLAIGATSLLVGVSFALLGGLTVATSGDTACPLSFDPMHLPAACDVNGIARQHNLGVASAAVGSALMITGVGLLVWPGPRQLVP